MTFAPEFPSPPEEKEEKKRANLMKVVAIEDIPQRDEIGKAPTKRGRDDGLLKVYKVCKQMEKVCDEREGVGLSAVQVGIPWRLFIIKTDGKYEYFLNCVYEPIGDDVITSIEGCLSLLSESGDFRRFELTRSLIVKVTGQKLTEVNGLTIESFSAYIHAEDQGVVFQHEIDHQLGPDGLISNKGKEILIW
tara:strand:- start:29888 stop:30460 length:573 start_codon:yes stop_codon:yes gene_type:complete